MMTAPLMIPVLATDRLILRPFARDDLDPFAEMVSDLEIMRYATYSGEVMSRSQAWNWLCMMLGHWPMRGFGIWGVEEKGTGDLIGRIGLQYLDWFDDVELVWMLRRSAWGQGYAEEGSQAAIRYGMETLKLPRLAALIHPENQPSIRLAERLGLELQRCVCRQEIEFLEYLITDKQQLPSA